MEWNLTCPHCHALHEFHSDLTRPGAQPKDGDVSICINCGEFAIFDLHERCLRPPTIDEANALDSDPDMLLYRQVWREATRKHPH
ncbi:hypothetical protein BOC54_36935 [Burkholderia pseudomallei]|nr:hypothetical protein BOC54_36935 [Burkholderia pseudomallei]